MSQRQVNFIYDSLKGSRRKVNKDGVLILIDEHYHILGVFDGVSSAFGARKAVNFALKYISQNHNNYFHNNSFNLSGMMRELNCALVETNIDEPYTTYSVAYISNNPEQKIKFSSLGDSRIYSVTKQYFLQLSRDHKDQVYSNILTKYLGNKDLTQSDFLTVEYDGTEHNFLICSDGFYTTMEMNHENLAEIHRVLNLKMFHYIKKGINKLIKGSNSDDASYVFVRWENV